MHTVEHATNRTLMFAYRRLPALPDTSATAEAHVRGVGVCCS